MRYMSTFAATPPVPFHWRHELIQPQSPLVFLALMDWAEEVLTHAECESLANMAAAIINQAKARSGAS